MRYLLLLVAGLLAGCASTETDSSTNSQLAYVRTRVNFAPFTRDERDRQLAHEKQVYEQKIVILRENLERAKAERTRRYDEIRHEFAFCYNQKHCISDLSRGDIRRFERYNFLTTSLREHDIKLVELEGAIKDWQRRFEMRNRAINNRYLVHELMLIPNVNPKVGRMLVHSLEAFDSRRTLSDRLLQYSDIDVAGATWGDLEFRMLQRPVDEAAVVATFDVFLPKTEETPPTRYVISFLVNSYQDDPLYYDQKMLRAWGDLLSEKEQKALRGKVLCGVYGIASETLAPKLDYRKAKPCAAERVRLQNLSATKF